MTSDPVLATRFAPEAFFTLQDKVPRTKTREAERRMAHPVPIAAPDARAQPRSNKRYRSPFGAPLRFFAEAFTPQLGLGRASWNHRIQTGGPSPAPVQRAPRRPPPGGGRDDAQAACEQKVTNSARRNRTRSVSRRLRLTSLTKSGMAAVFQIAAALSKELFPNYRLDTTHTKASIYGRFLGLH